MSKTLKLLTISLFIITICLNAAPTFSGGSDGYITMPSTSVAYKKRFGFGIKYLGLSSSTLTPVFNFVPVIKNNIAFEIGASLDLVTSSQTNVISPILASFKLQFSKNGAVGGWFELPVNNNQIFAFNLYVGWRSQFKIGKLGSGNATVALGYTFQENMNDNINFFSGFSQELGRKNILLIADIANFSYRHSGFRFNWLGTGVLGLNNQNPNRGIINIGVRILPVDWISIDIVGADLMDANRGIILGINFYM